MTAPTGTIITINNININININTNKGHPQNPPASSWPPPSLQLLMLLLMLLMLLLLLLLLLNPRLGLSFRLTVQVSLKFAKVIFSTQERYLCFTRKSKEALPQGQHLVPLYCST
jgi:hypothetical protein